MRGSIWSNRENQNGDFDQANKVKSLWEKMPDCYERKCLISMEENVWFLWEEKAWFYTDLFSDFQSGFSVGSLELNL